jgi:AcrR family transcriptional regulator
LNKPVSPFLTPQQKLDKRNTKRNAVLRAAVRIFNERGFHATSLEDVATSLGITKPTIYHYLGNKDQVLLECVTIGLNQLLAAADQARAEPGTGIERLQIFLRRYSEIIMDDYGRCVIRTGEEALAPASIRRFRELKRAIDTAMRALINEGISDGSIAPIDSKLLAFTLAGALNWPARWHNPNGGRNTWELAEQLVSLLTTGFEPR